MSMAREEMISPDIQRSAITDWARRTGRRIVRWIEDLDETGRNFKRRIIEGITAIEAGEAREIVAYRYDRWGRNAVGSLANVHRVEAVGGQVQSATEPYDAETAVGKYSRTNAFAIAEMQSDIIGENWSAAINNRIERGMTGTGTPRWGYIRKGRIPDLDRPGRYRRDPDDPLGERYEPDPELSGAYVSLYERYVAGEGSHQLVRWLNVNGFRTVRGGQWHMTTVLQLLDSGFAAGLLRVHDRRCKCGQPMRCTKVVYVEGAHKAIIGMGLWEEYLRVRERTRDMGPRTKQALYPLASLIKCGHCGFALSAANAMGVRGFGYRCTIFRQRPDVCEGVWCKRVDAEEAVLAKLREKVSDLDARASLTTAREAMRAAAYADRERLTRELVRVDQSLRKLARQQLMDEGMPEAIYAELRDELLTSRRDLEKELDRTKEEERQADVDHEPVIRGLLEEWDTLPVQQRRAMLARLIRYVKVYRTGPRRPPRFEVRGTWEPEIA
ncbi:DNA invertase Pin-like site-specific DNA recombinase [Nonomuraea soli]|uniref:DNA invertase Pin-like site-specific DNA recombinase n=1 Tax=Nonomuraea soli TaxID=1032476 RepID=A0A7W0HVM2_9ACTN|nr:DNA invertase Pin-like site-specific DNA recombinase [Nonomuraea soli]